MDIILIVFVFQCMHSVDSQSTIKDSQVSSNTVENRLMALEEENRRLVQTLQGMLLSFFRYNVSI